MTVLVVGAAASGRAALKVLKDAGKKVVLFDHDPTAVVGIDADVVGSGEWDSELLAGIDLVVASPGGPEHSAPLAEAVAAGIPVWSELELGYRRAELPVIAVTGTNGKTTVAALTGHLLRAAKIDCEVAGNIGPAALDALLKRVANPPAAWVLELSSYQLETTWSLAPDAAAMLNLSEDHLDRYAGLAEYGAAKARIFYGAALQVLNRCDSASMAMSLPARAQVTFGMDAPAMAEDFGLADGFLARGTQRILAAEDLPIHGRHNVSNALAACALAHAAGAPLESLAAGLRSFRGLPHRVQRVAEREGVAWYDDSKGTNVGAAIAALEGMGRKTVLIAGGEGKGQDFAPLAPAVRAHARAVLLIGRDAPLIEKALASSGVALEQCKTLQAAVKRAAKLAQKGDAVLLSPACASFDMFRDYAHRGEVFAKAVRDLANG